MACDCLAQLNRDLLEHNTRICEAFQPGLLEPVVVIQHERLSDDRDDVTIVRPNFCPFCGAAYGQAPANGVTLPGEASHHVH
jgi:hypothetical protein